MNFGASDFELLRDATGLEFKPWRLEQGGILGYQAVNDYADAAGNTVDNVEVVEFIAHAGGDYTVRVNHKGTLAAPQALSLIMSENHRRIMRLQANDPLILQIVTLMSSTENEGGAILADPGTHPTGEITITQPITLMASGGEAAPQ